MALAHCCPERWRNRADEARSHRPEARRGWPGRSPAGQTQSPARRWFPTAEPRWQIPRLPAAGTAPRCSSRPAPSAVKMLRRLRARSWLTATRIRKGRSAGSGTGPRPASEACNSRSDFHSRAQSRHSSRCASISCISRPFNRPSKYSVKPACTSLQPFIAPPLQGHLHPCQRCGPRRALRRQRRL